jgi:hypothetical protein
MNRVNGSSYLFSDHSKWLHKAGADRDPSEAGMSCNHDRSVIVVRKRDLRTDSTWCLVQCPRIVPGKQINHLNEAGYPWRRGIEYQVYCRCPAMAIAVSEGAYPGVLNTRNCEWFPL